MSADAPVAVGLQSVLDLIEKLRSAHERFCVVTVVKTANATSAKPGAKAVVDANGAIHGHVGGGCVQSAVREAAKQAMATGAAGMIRVKPSDEVESETDADGTDLYKSGCPSRGTMELFLEPHSRPQAYVLGASPVAAACISCARLTGFAPVVCAPASEHARVPGASSYVDGYDFGTAAPGEWDPVIVATQGRSDADALKAALGSPARWVGMVASPRKAQALREKLAGKVDAERLKGLSAPAGLDIKAIGPEEIALSIFAEIIQVRHARFGDRG